MSNFAPGSHDPKTAAVNAVEAGEGGWQPIATAPKDGTAILAFGQWAGEINGILPGQQVSIVQWSGGHTDYAGFDWLCSDGDAYACWLKATHWMLLPAPPATER